jgi:hypothetical protein
MKKHTPCRERRWGRGKRGSEGAGLERLGDANLEGVVVDVRQVDPLAQDPLPKVFGSVHRGEDAKDLLVFVTGVTRREPN